MYIYIYNESNTPVYLGDSLGSAAATVVLVVFPDLRLCADSRQVWGLEFTQVGAGFWCPGCCPAPFRPALGESCHSRCGSCHDCCGLCWLCAGPLLSKDGDVSWLGILVMIGD